MRCGNESGTVHLQVTSSGAVCTLEGVCFGDPPKFQGDLTERTRTFDANRCGVSRGDFLGGCVVGVDVPVASPGQMTIGFPFGNL
jgi:hypothetical protein